jgi:hypothetical protein
MRPGGLLIITLVASGLTGCGDQDTGMSKDQSGVAGRVLVGPQCPVEAEADPCQDEPAVGARVTIAEQLPGSPDAGGEVVARTTTAADGSYRVAVPSGRYVVTAQAGMSCEQVRTRVAAGAYTNVDVACDSGIR